MRPRLAAFSYTCSCDLCSCGNTVGKEDGICGDCLKADHS